MPAANETTKRQLVEAAARRTLAAEDRVRKALPELDREGAAISFAAVADRARVSRAFLYAHGDFRAEIETLRGTQVSASPRLPVRQQAQIDWSHEQPIRTSSGLELPLFCFHMVLGPLP